MILLLVNYLNNYFHIPRVFEFYSFRMGLSALTSLLVTILYGKVFIKKLYELKIGQTIRKEECPVLGELHQNKEHTPTMGGILILFSMFISLLLWMDLSHPFTIILALVTLILGTLGAIDDFLKIKYKNSKGLSGKKKILCQLIFAVLLSFYLLGPFSQKYGEYISWLYVPFIKGPLIHFSGAFVLLLALLWFLVISGSSNAVNLTDGLDGLAAGNLIMVASSLAIIAFVSNHFQISKYLNILYVEGSGEIAIYLSALVGGCLGFLWYNSYPAQVFMGDTGSLPLGGILGVSAILLRKELLLIIIGGIFVAEALSVILQVGSFKLRNKRRIFKCAPLHHHFEYLGLPETKVVMRFWIIGFLLSIIGIISIKFQ
ncbi:MAG: Phospho-N-acetylmuramoyl-pentapeptide-transferase [Chlamydiae bacterium]|nr:Phospho-N-acetylmuramoyl-pentapeptide-transferase [Chlamydiota bacterium]